MSIILLGSPDWAGYRTVQDVVFSDIATGKNQFSLSWIKADAKIDIKESQRPNENNLMHGTGLFRIDGTLSIVQNGLFTYGQLLRIPAEADPDALYEAYVLFRDQKVMSLTPSIGTEPRTGDFRSYLFDRYPLIADWDSSRGIAISLATALGGSNMAHTFNLSGFAYDAIQFETGDFYGMFPNLQR